MSYPSGAWGRDGYGWHDDEREEDGIDVGAAFKAIKELKKRSQS